MAKFRRSFRRTRRRSGPETYTVLQCRNSTNVWTDTPCGSSLSNLIPIMIPSPSVGLDATTAAATLGQKAIVVEGIKFSAEHFIDPGTALDGDTGPQPSIAAFILTIWEALIVLPLLAGTKNIPAFIPQLTAGSQSTDLADRVLWKRITHNPFWGLDVTGPIPQLQSNVRDTDHGNQSVKSRVRLDDKHGLFYIRNFVHDLVLAPTDGQLPVILDAWFKVFYRVKH